MNEIKCSECNTVIELKDYTGFPLYYFGAGPNNPQDAEHYFCGPICSNSFKREGKLNDSTGNS
jgi:hypothetical protein